jgi:hypothetical protein
MGIIERIFSFIDYKGISVNEFSKKIDVSNGYLAKQRLSNANVGSQIIEKIVNIYPDISIEWLVTGKGEMLRQTKSTETSPTQISEVIQRADSEDKDKNKNSDNQENPQKKDAPVSIDLAMILDRYELLAGKVVKLEERIRQLESENADLKSKDKRLSGSTYPVHVEQAAIASVRVGDVLTK